jgi:hypothetical protein
MQLRKALSQGSRFLGRASGDLQRALNVSSTTLGLIDTCRDAANLAAIEACAELAFVVSIGVVAVEIADAATRRAIRIDSSAQHQGANHTYSDPIQFHG